MNFQYQDIVAGLQNLGLTNGDVVLVRAALKSIGVINEKPSTHLVKALLEVVGSQGTVLGLAFNKMNLFPELHRKHVVTPSTPPVTGGLVKAMVNWPGAYRSLHPTNSFVAIGKHAHEILKDHDKKATCFQPIEKIIEYDGKMILIGCVKSSPGFSSVHLAQERLGLATRSILKNMRGTYYQSGRHIKLFKQQDIPTCSMGFSNFYPHYLMDNKLTVAHVGNAYSIGIKARDAFQIELNMLKKNPKIALCHNLDCISCRATLFYNMTDIPKFCVHKLMTSIKNAILKVKRVRMSGRQ